MSELDHLKKEIVEANQMAIDGNFPQAYNLYQDMITRYPDEPVLREQLMMLSFRYGFYKVVLEQQLALAEEEYHHGNDSKAIARYQEILRLPEVVYGQSGKHESRKIEAEIEPLKADIFYQMGDYYLEKSQPLIAVQFLEKSDNLSPDQWDTQMALGQVHLLLGHLSRAAHHFNEVIRLVPENASVAYEFMGDIYLKQNRPAYHVVIWFRYSAQSYLANLELEQAKRMYQRVLDVDPSDVDAQKQLKNLGLKRAGLGRTLLASERSSQESTLGDRLIPKIGGVSDEI